MKSLSVKVPWCGLIASGRKSLEVRTWRTDYRGPLLIVSSMQADRSSLHLLPRDAAPVFGAAVCVVDLLNVRPLASDDSEQAGFDVTGCEADRVFAWVLGSPHRTEPTRIRGRLNLYDVPDSSIRLVGTRGPWRAPGECWRDGHAFEARACRVCGARQPRRRPRRDDDVMIARMPVVSLVAGTDKPRARRARGIR